MRAIARAHANIALIKYWGKADVRRNLPAVPSLSLTLDGLLTQTEVELDASLVADQVYLDGQELSGLPYQRVKQLLDNLRVLAEVHTPMRVTSHNHFPTAAGLASSASGFAALVVAAGHALDLGLSAEQQSAFARAASASAGRSIFGGWVELLAGADSARQVAPGSHLDVEMLVAVTRRGPKQVASTRGMQHTLETSPYYPAWVGAAPAVFDRGKGALLARDLGALGRAMEHSTLLMHASMLAADPAIIYFAPPTIAILERVRELRAAGTEAYFTMDAGPHVKVLTPSGFSARVFTALSEVPGVLEVLRCTPGPAAHLVEAE